MVRPASSHHVLKRARPLASSSVSVWRLLPPATPGPISAISWMESHRRSPLILRLSVGFGHRHSQISVSRCIGLRPAVPEELPSVAHLADHVQVHLVDDQLVLVAAGDLLDLAARIDEIALAVELADVPRRLGADPVDGADVDAVGDRARRLLELPQIFGEAGHGRRRVDDVFGAVQRQRPPAFREMAVVADVDAELAVGGLEHRPVGGAGLEEELLPEAADMRNVGLAVLAEIACRRRR